MAVTIEKVAEFLFAYASSYRDAYIKATTPRPYGAGYPALISTPYMEASSLDVYVANNGVVVVEEKEPDHEWYVAGGPALKIDYEPTRTPVAVTDAIAAHGLIGKPIGIYRIVSKSDLPAPVWKGRVRGIARELKTRNKTSGISLHLREVRSSLDEVVDRKSVV